MYNHIISSDLHYIYPTEFLFNFIENLKNKAYEEDEF